MRRVACWSPCSCDPHLRRCSSDTRSARPSRPPSLRENEQAWKEHVVMASNSSLYAGRNCTGTPSQYALVFFAVPLRAQGFI